jgi:hypothetical protein
MVGKIMPTRKKTTKKYPRLTWRERALAAKYIAEEVATRNYPPAQAKAIGISRARTKVKKERQKKR